MIHVLQYVCPQRHCLFALAWDDTGTQVEKVKETGERKAKEWGINPWCGICGSRDLHWSDGVTKWKTLDEAQASLQEVQKANLITRMLMDAAGLTYEQHRKN